MNGSKKKLERGRSVLFSLIDLFLKTGRPIGSKTLMDNGFRDLSSATIRNYFVQLEKEGYLIQQHSSGGRIPTSVALRLYAISHIKKNEPLEKGQQKLLQNELSRETKEVGYYLQHAGEVLSQISKCAVFFSSPRFDQDFVQKIKLVSINANRYVAVIISQLGVVRSEVLHTKEKIRPACLQKLERFFMDRLNEETEGQKPLHLSPSQSRLAERFYNEILLRHIAGYANFSVDNVEKTGFSQLIKYPELQDARALAHSLSIFENTTHMRNLLSECVSQEKLRVWVGPEASYGACPDMNCSIIAIPYFILGRPVGAFALLGPIRMPYKRLFSILRQFETLLSKTLTKTMYRFKITYREAASKHLALQTKAPIALTQAKSFKI